MCVDKEVFIMSFALLVLWCVLCNVTGGIGNIDLFCDGTCVWYDVMRQQRHACIQKQDTTSSSLRSRVKIVAVILVRKANQLLCSFITHHTQ